jgi:hypothetical protein
MADKSTQLPMPVHLQMPFSRPPTPHAHPLQIGFYGLGNMGYLMARNLATYQSSHSIASPPLLVYNRTLSKCEQLATETGGKVRIAQSAAQFAIECDIIITNLANDDVVKMVYIEFAKALTVRVACLAIGVCCVLILVFLIASKHPRLRTRSLSKLAQYAY